MMVSRKIETNLFSLKKTKKYTLDMEKTNNCLHKRDKQVPSIVFISLKANRRDTQKVKTPKNSCVCQVI